MSDYVKTILADVKAKNPSEPEFHQAIEEVTESLDLVFERHPEYRYSKILISIISWDIYKIFTFSITNYRFLRRTIFNRRFFRCSSIYHAGW